MHKNRTSLFAMMVTLVFMLAIYGGAGIGCDGVNIDVTPSQQPLTSDQSHPSEASQSLGGTPPTGDSQPPEGMQPPVFNLSDEEFDAVLQRAIDDGNITEEQAQEISAWWQQRPTEGMPPPGDRQPPEGMPPTGDSQPPGGTPLTGDSQPPGGMPPPGDRQPPQGMQPSVFNLSDEEFDAVLQGAINDGHITEEQAQEISTWWQQRPFTTGEITSDT